MFLFFFSSRRRHTRWPRDWSSDVCSSDLSTNYLTIPMIPIYCIPCKIIVQCSVYSDIRTNDGVWGDFCSCCKIIGNTLIHCSPLSAGISYPSTVYLEDRSEERRVVKWISR